MSVRALHACVVFLASTALAACAAPDDSSEDDVAAADNALHAASKGYYAFVGEHNHRRWLEAFALHGDGTFEANVGNNVSNLSGHHFPAAGTYSLQSATGEGYVLTMTYDFFGHAVDAYDVQLDGNGWRMKLREDDTTWFTVEKKNAVTITFGADWTATPNGPLVAGSPLIVRYAATRSSCAAPAGGSHALSLNASVDNVARWSVVAPFPQEPSNGFFGTLGSVPENGTHLAVWFKDEARDMNQSVVCSKWDSSFGNNYHFTIAPR